MSGLLKYLLDYTAMAGLRSYTLTVTRNGTGAANFTGSVDLLQYLSTALLNSGVAISGFVNCFL
jgi:hypothetical protein